MVFILSSYIRQQSTERLRSFAPRSHSCPVLEPGSESREAVTGQLFTTKLFTDPVYKQALPSASLRNTPPLPTSNEVWPFTLYFRTATKACSHYSALAVFPEGGRVRYQVCVWGGPSASCASCGGSFLLAPLALRGL